MLCLRKLSFSGCARDATGEWERLESEMSSSTWLDGTSIEVTGGEPSTDAIR